MIVSDYDEICERYSALQQDHVCWSGDPSARFIEKSLDGVNGPILDAGCGTGGLALHLSQKGYDVSGVDTSQACIAVARQRVGQKAVHASMERVPFPGGSFDAIISRYALHYLNRFNLAYQEFHRLLRPQGIIAITSEHPLMDAHLNGRYASGLQTKYPLHGMTLHFPSHIFTDYFSPTFCELFAIQDFDEGKEDYKADLADIPAYIAFAARKKP